MLMNWNIFRKAEKSAIPMIETDKSVENDTPVPEIEFVKRSGKYTVAEHRATYATGPSFPDRLP